jgi:hypothetical protein
MTVGGIRKAIAGMPDDAFVSLWHYFTDESEGGAIVELVDAMSDGSYLILKLEITVSDELDFDDDDAEDEEE